jgi:uncharacterized protein HemY
LRQTPNRFRGVYGAARAAEAMGNRKEAIEYYDKLIALAGNGDGSRPEVTRARDHVGKH